MVPGPEPAAAGPADRRALHAGQRLAVGQRPHGTAGRRGARARLPSGDEHREGARRLGAALEKGSEGQELYGSKRIIYLLLLVIMLLFLSFLLLWLSLSTLKSSQLKVELFSFLSDKDLFAEIYRNQLSKRLLYETSASEDAEKSMIAKLKMKWGFEKALRLSSI